MSPFYLVGQLIGYFWLFLIFCIVAISLAAKGGAPWIIFGVGFLLTVFSLRGAAVRDNILYGSLSTITIIRIVVLAVLSILCVGAILLLKRRKSREEAAEEPAEEDSSDESDPAAQE